MRWASSAFAGGDRPAVDGDDRIPRSGAPFGDPDRDLAAVRDQERADRAGSGTCRHPRERRTRHAARPPILLAGSRPSAIQRCTVRAVTPSSAAASRGVSSSSAMSRLSQVGACRSGGPAVAAASRGRRPGPPGPRRRCVAPRCAAACALRVQRRRARRISRTSDFAARAAVGPRSGAPRPDRDPLVERRLVRHHLVDQADPQRALGPEALAGREQRPRVRLSDLRDDERADHRRDDAQLTSVNPNVASAVATTTSLTAHRPIPPPSAAP